MMDSVSVHHPLDGIHEKLDRADEHLDRVVAEIESFVNEGKAYSHAGEFEPERQAWVERLRVHREPPLRFGVLVGDYIHNLRSALDHLVWALTRLDGGRPDRLTQFPITKSEDGFKSEATKRIPRLSERHRAMIERAQPYNGPDGFKLHPLYLLRELSNSDKHRVVQPSYAHLAPPHVTFSGSVQRVTAPVPWMRLEDGAELLVVHTQATSDPPSEMNVDGDFLVEIAFGEQAVTSNGLDLIRGAVKGTVDAFSGDFPARE